MTAQQQSTANALSRKLELLRGHLNALLETRERCHRVWWRRASVSRALRSPWQLGYIGRGGAERVLHCGGIDIKKCAVVLLVWQQVGAPKSCIAGV